MSEFYVAVGDATSFSKTVGEYDVYGFAGITGDFAPNHVNKAYMEKSGYGGLIAHGALLVGYMSTASTQMAMHSRADASVTGVSLGYDRMRFLAPVYFGDTITVTTASRRSIRRSCARPPTSGSPTRTARWSRSRSIC